MNKFLCGVIGGVIGAAAGAGATYYILKKKYEQKLNEEITTARETYTRMAKDLANKNENEKANMFKDQPVIQVEKKIVVSKPDDIPQVEVAEDFDDDNEEEDSKKGLIIERVSSNIPMGAIKTSKPYTISPELFGSEDDYALKTLHYYWGDKTLTDEDDNIIDSPDTTVGVANLDKFGEYEEYTVYVRNDNHMTDYEILLDEMSYASSHS